MTDRTQILTVYLNKEYRIDDVEQLKNAISLLQDVAKVEHSVSNIDFRQAKEIAKIELKNEFFYKIMDVLNA